MEFDEFKANRLIDFINHIKDNPKQFSKTKYLYILYDNYKKVDSYIGVIKKGR